MEIIKKFIAEVLSVIMCISMLQPIIVSAQTAKNEIVNADIYVSLSAYVPTISGAISCADGKVVTLNINNITNNTVIANQTITGEAGNQNISYTLPSLVSSKKYEVIISCTENGNSLAYMSVILDSSILAVNITGTATTANNVDVNASLQTTNTGLVDKNISFTGNKELSTTIPNLLPSASFHLTAVGYETITIPDSDPTPTSTPDINASSDDITAQLEKTDDRIIVTGNTRAGEVTILVTDSNDEIAYVDQIESEANGQYIFDFRLPLNAVSGEYNAKVGGEGINTPLILSFMHTPATEPDSTPDPTPTEIPIITAQLTKNDDNIIVTGNTRAGEVTILVTAPNDEIAYVNQIESEANGQYTFDFRLPINSMSGEYDVKVGGEGVRNPVDLKFTYIVSSNSDVTPTPTPEPEFVTEYTISRSSNDGFKLILNAENIEKFIDRTFVVKYDTSVITPISYWGLGYDNSTEAGLHESINIISDTNGEIKFTIMGETIPSNKVWNGVINVFKFRFISPTGGFTKIQFYEK